MPIAKKNIPQDFLDQMKTNLTMDTSDTEKAPETRHTAVSAQVVKSAEESAAIDTKKEKYADVMNVRLSKGRRNEIKTFCTSCGISITQYIESSFEYLAKEVAAGKLIISKGGITKVED